MGRMQELFRLRWTNMEARDGRTDDPVRVAADNLRVDAATAEVARALDAAAIPHILLKGPSVARWLYPEGGRGYSDSDLLVSPSSVQAAEAVLESMGFRRRYDTSGLPDWWVDHA